MTNLCQIFIARLSYQHMQKEEMKEKLILCSLMMFPDSLLFFYAIFFVVVFCIMK